MRSTRRLPAAAGAALVALAIAALGACTGSGSPDSSAPDGKAATIDGATVSPAPPGKYQTLPQPCIAVDLDALKKLVPGAADYAGRESLTYDTDRRVGCTWKGTDSDGTSRSLTIDFERVVSYDPAVSDEVQAESDFDRQAAAASISLTPAGGNPETTPPTTPVNTPPTNPADNATADAAGSDSGPTTDDAVTDPATAGPDGPDGADANSPDLAPRLLTDVGNAAFINDVLKARTAASHRDVTLVFRTANVLATVSYSASSAHDVQRLSSADLQKGAKQVAEQLEHRVEQ
ncbi:MULTISPECIES: hypothetical protein [unclassified Streptomyces]|uniref:hypothetical protein n=1 Tax=unclassified Streptomyces TaxID=2593676 RepID=UPI002E2A558D|nr:hypothetical protein [Streptomyces sp. NBC_00223]